MKTALIFFRSRESMFDGEYYEKVVNAFNGGGLDIDTVEVLSDTDDIGFNRRLEEFMDTADNLIIVGGDSLSFDFRDVIASVMDAPFAENENAKNFLDAVSKSDGIHYPDEFAEIPVDSIVIPNIHGAFQGYILDQNQFTLAVLPEDFESVKLMCDKYLLPYLENKYNIKRTRLTLKYFGDRSKIEKTLYEAQNIGDGFEWNIYEKYGDKTIELIFDNAEDEIRAEAVRYIVLNHKDDIYAEFDTTLEERLFDLLKLKKQRLSVAESFTAGRVVSSVIKNSGASEFVYEGIVSYSEISKIARLGVSEYDLKSKGAVSSVVAYQMAVGLLKTGKCDIAISTTGLAGPKSDDSDKPVGLCYIAVGMKDGVHTYKFNLSGSREEITEKAKNTALFLAIQKLKSI